MTYIGALSVFKDTKEKGVDKADRTLLDLPPHYLTLKSFHERKRWLRAMCTSEEWATSIYTCTTQAKKVEAILLYDNKFWKAIQYCIKCVLPLVKVLRLVDGDARPPMGYIYEAMDRAKEEIAKNFNQKEKNYKKIWEIVDARWDMQLHRPLHAAAYFLNPKYVFISFLF